MKQIFTSAKETVALTRNAGSISLFAGATLGLAGTVVLNAKDAAEIGAELMLAAFELDGEVTGEVLSGEHGRRLNEASENAARLQYERESDKAREREAEELKNAGEVDLETAAERLYGDPTAGSQDNKPASSQDGETPSKPDGQTSSDKVSLQATSATGKTDDQTKAVGEALSQETKPASSEAPKPAARRGRKPKASA